MRFKEVGEMAALGNFVKFGLGMRLAVALIIAGAILLWNSVSAHDYSPPARWDTSVTPNTTSVDTQYASAIRSAANDYTSNTDLRVDWCDAPCGNIWHYEGDFGRGNWAARVYTRGNPISSAIVRWNAHHGRFDSFTAHRIARHELGHAFGLDHVPCGGGPYETSPPSIMGCPSNRVKDLHTHDIDDINAKY